MGDLFPGLDEFMEEKEAGSQQAYEQKMLKKLYDLILSEEQFKEDRREAGEDFGFHWFNDARYLMIQLFAKRRIVVNPIHLIRTDGFTKTPVWAEYFKIKNVLPKDAEVAMFFPVVKASHFVIHNSKSLDVSSGYNVISRLGRSGSTLLRIEPVPAFLEAVSRRIGRGK